MLLTSSERTPLGTLYLVGDGEFLLGAGFRSHADLIRRMSEEDKAHKKSPVRSLPVISRAVREYFDGNLDAFNSLKCRQPGGDFYQSVYKRQDYSMSSCH